MVEQMVALIGAVPLYGTSPQKPSREYHERAKLRCAWAVTPVPCTEQPNPAEPVAGCPRREGPVVKREEKLNSQFLPLTISLSLRTQCGNKETTPFSLGPFDERWISQGFVEVVIVVGFLMCSVINSNSMALHQKTQQKKSEGKMK
ncbi:uncharacterized protein LOC113584897 isoform X2 [Electrophorus electricus]|nr:uncharacterized protein LOC113584897 isoform X2 [Electrophorus electricus]